MTLEISGIAELFGMVSASLWIASLEPERYEKAPSCTRLMVFGYFGVQLYSDATPDAALSASRSCPFAGASKQLEGVGFPGKPALGNLVNVVIVEDEEKISLSSVSF